MAVLGSMAGFLVTADYDKARSFYEGRMGFKFVSLDQFALVMHTGTNMIRISKVKDFTAARYTVLGWTVDDIEAVVATLKEKGVEFEDYPFIDNHTTRIWTAPGGDKIAWFKDPDGNVLSVSQHK